MAKSKCRPSGVQRGVPRGRSMVKGSMIPKPKKTARG